MNERIKELAEQAGFDPAAIERMGIMPNAEKFAELIVRECIAIADEFEIEVNRSGLVDRMKEHFGVEE